METAIISSKEIFDEKKNPTKCLSAKRYNWGCVNCSIFLQYLKWARKEDNGKTKTTVKETIESMKCKPLIDRGQMEWLEQQNELYRRKKEFNKGIDKKIRDIDDKLKRTEWR